MTIFSFPYHIKCFSALWPLALDAVVHIFWNCSKAAILKHFDLKTPLFLKYYWRLHRSLCIFLSIGFDHIKNFKWPFKNIFIYSLKIVIKKFITDTLVQLFGVSCPFIQAKGDVSSNSLPEKEKLIIQIRPRASKN